MSWICPTCQYVNADSDVRCACDGHVRRSRLELSVPEGGDGVWRTTISADVTRRAYRRLYPGTEHQYVPRNDGEHPFSVVRTASTPWTLVANGASPIRTVLDGVPCNPGQEYPLKTGDVIAIAPAGNPSRQYAPLKVELVPME